MWYDRLIIGHIGESREINWEVLHEVGLGKEVQCLLNVEAWCQLFSITNTNYRDFTMKVLASFEFTRGMVSFHKAGTIQFQAFGGPVLYESNKVLCQSGVIG